MFEYIYKFAKQNNCVFISLIAEEDNIVAQSFYEKLGYIIGEEVEDDLADKIFKSFCMGK